MGLSWDSRTCHGALRESPRWCLRGSIPGVVPGCQSRPGRRRPRSRSPPLHRGLSVRILFDQGTPAPLRRALPGHEVSTVYEFGWSTLPDGPLLAAAEQAGFELFITTDQQLRFQQRLTGRHLAILVLGSTSWPRIAPHGEAIRQMVERLTAGSYHEFPIPSPAI